MTRLDDNVEKDSSILGYFLAILKMFPVLAVSWVFAVFCPAIAAAIACIVLHFVYMSAMRSERFRFAQPWMFFAVNNLFAIVVALFRLVYQFLNDLT